MLEPTTPTVKSGDRDPSQSSRDSRIPKCGREKIVFCVDLDVSMNEHFFVAGEKSQDTRINRTKQLLKWFIDQKLRWNKKHEFALMILGEHALWHMDFTSDKVLLSHAIDGLYSMGDFKAFDFTSIVLELLNHVDLNEEDEDVTVRVIMIYTRSNVIPSKPDSELQTALYTSGKFFFDCVYIHNKASEVSGDIKPQHVYDRLTEFEDARYPCYFYELTRILKKYTTAMSELLAHPAIRLPQDDKPALISPPPSVQQEMAEQRLKKAQRSESIPLLSNKEQQQQQQLQQQQQQQQQKQQQQHKQHVQQIQQMQQKQQHQQVQQHQHQPSTPQRQLSQSPLPTQDLRPTQSDLIPFAQQAFNSANNGSGVGGGVSGMGSPNSRPFQASIFAPGSSSPSVTSAPLQLGSQRSPQSQPLTPPPNHGSSRDLSASPQANRPTPLLARQGSFPLSDPRSPPSASSTSEPGDAAENAILL